MWESDPKSIGPWAWGREDAGVAAAEATPEEVEVGIREVGEAVIPAAAEVIRGEAAIPVVEDSSPKVVIRAKRKGPRPQMTLLSSTRCWTSWEPSFQ